MYLLTKSVSENIFAMVFSSYHNLPSYGTITCVWLTLNPILLDRWSTWLLLLVSLTNWVLLKGSIKNTLPSRMLFLRSHSAMMIHSLLDLLYKSPTILLNTCMNRLCYWINVCAPVFYILTSDILSSSYIVDCDFLFPDYGSAFFDS